MLTHVVAAKKATLYRKPFDVNSPQDAFDTVKSISKRSDHCVRISVRLSGAGEGFLKHRGYAAQGRRGTLSSRQYLRQAGKTAKKRERGEGSAQRIGVGILEGGQCGSFFEGRKMSPHAYLQNVKNVKATSSRRTPGVEKVAGMILGGDRGKKSVKKGRR